MNRKRTRLKNIICTDTEMQFNWAIHNYYSIAMRTIILHTIHAGALENYTKSNNTTKLLTEL